MTLCPGKINNNDTLNWYIPINSKNEAYCENCIMKFGDSIEHKYFTIEHGLQYHCCYNRNFDNSCLIIENIRVSIVNPDNLYRFPIRKNLSIWRNEQIISAELPFDQNYMIVLEMHNENNQDNENNKINIMSMTYNGNKEMHNRKPEEHIIIDSVSNLPNLIFKEYSLIGLSIAKWKRRNDHELSKYYIIEGNPINVKINLLRNDAILNEMNCQLNFRNIINKTVVINDFI